MREYTQPFLTYSENYVQCSANFSLRGCVMITYSPMAEKESVSGIHATSCGEIYIADRMNKYSLAFLNLSIFSEINLKTRATEFPPSKYPEGKEDIFPDFLPVPRLASQHFLLHRDFLSNPSTKKSPPPSFLGHLPSSSPDIFLHI